LTKLGASDVWSGQVTGSQIVEDLHSAAQLKNTTRESASAREGWCDGLVGESDPMRRVFDVIRLVASRRSTVLITGETGTGKEVVARAIQAAGGRDRLPFVAVNCAAIPENLIESELFGHSKGAFTGASQCRQGRFEQANGGTLFLDEIGELAPSMQVKLLRVLQEREVQRLGSNDPIRLNIRVIAATNLDLESAVRARTFRQDLYYRLNVVPLHLPPLRERLADLPLLVAHFLEKICRSERMGRKSVSSAALERLSSNDWPGNIRQLEHAIEMAVVLSGDRTVLEDGDFAMLTRTPGTRVGGAAPLVHVPDEGLDFDETVTRIERSILHQALTKSGGNKARAAELLRMKRTTLLAKMKSFEDLDSRDTLTFPNRISVCQGVFAAAG
jgi:transcriptional regulator with GAF, ATPase, and Fis domain